MNRAEGRDQSTERIEICWRMATESGHQFICWVHRRGLHLEVRVTMGEANLLYSQVVSSHDEAHALSDRWRQALLARGHAIVLGE